VNERCNCGHLNETCTREPGEMVLPHGPLLKQMQSVVSSARLVREAQRSRIPFALPVALSSLNAALVELDGGPPPYSDEITVG
jgi:hypothetical protein